MKTFKLPSAALLLAATLAACAPGSNNNGAPKQAPQDQTNSGQKIEVDTAIGAITIDRQRAVDANGAIIYNEYRMKVTSPNNKALVLRVHDLSENRVDHFSNSSDGHVSRETVFPISLVNKPLQPRTFRITAYSGDLELLVEEFQFLPDLIIKDKIVLSDVAPQQKELRLGYLVFESDSRLILSGQRIEIFTEDLIAKNGKVESFDKSLESLIPNVGLPGVSGGEFLVTAEKAKGSLSFYLRGSQGGAGNPGTPSSQQGSPGAPGSRGIGVRDCSVAVSRVPSDGVTMTAMSMASFDRPSEVKIARVCPMVCEVGPGAGQRGGVGGKGFAGQKGARGGASGFADITVRDNLGFTILVDAKAGDGGVGGEGGRGGPGGVGGAAGDPGPACSARAAAGAQGPEGPKGDNGISGDVGERQISYLRFGENSYSEY